MRAWIDIAPGLRLTGEGLAWLTEERVIIAADLHLGYELAAQRRGGYLPPVMRGTDVGTRLVAIARRLGAQRLVIAGDLRHSTQDVDELERAELAALAQVVAREMAFDVVLGNHDRGGALAGTEPLASLMIGPVHVTHLPPRTTPDHWTVCGHLHPRITVRDETGASARYPCALVGTRLLVLPALSDWAGGTEARRLMRELPRGEWRAVPISDGMVADLGIVLSSGGD